MHHVEAFLSRTRIAHFSMEIALRPEIHTYSGGLGVLAGDTARSAADLGLPMVFVSLVSRAGYVRQEIDGEGRQIAQPNPWRPEDWAKPLTAMIAVAIESREVWLRAWLYELSSPLGHRVPVLLLDTDLDQNEPGDRELTHYLYGGDSAYRLKQEIVLGIGGAEMLRALGFTIETYHLNEGHAALLTLSLLRPFRRPDEDIIPGEPLYEHMSVRKCCVFTTHTPVEAGLDKFDYALVQRVLDDYLEIDELKLLAGQDRLNMTRLALNLSGFVNGVSERHAETASHIFPGYRVRAITNGVHPATWTHPNFARLYQENFPHWAHEPEALARADQLPDEAIWSAHQGAKQDLLATVKQQTGVVMREDVPLLGFARRMTQYKRPDLLFTDIGRLTAIAQKQPFQLVFAGLAHPRDEAGIALIKTIHGHMRELRANIPIAYLPNYDMQIAARMVAGVDIWLNTPLPPMEASGTSGMKAAVNGVLNLSVLDGWWIEALIEGVTGWSIGTSDGPTGDGAQATELYDKLEKIVLPLYRDDRTRWIWMMKQAISKIASYFNSQRMMRRYATEAYIGER
ncbi:MAG TPA: alpha-glucan family phosphorylase [Roseiarcus sp.]|nr:alpha-glucan family phosphorylase [Roseiarcus sp.]